MDPETDAPGDTEGTDDKPTSEAASAGSEAPPADKSGGDETSSTAEAPKYTEKQLQEILHKRTKEYSAKLEPWGKFGTPEQVSERLQRLQALETQAKSQEPSTQPAVRTAEQEAFRKFMLEEFPELGRFSKVEKQVEGFGAEDQRRWDAFTETGREKVVELAKKDLSIEDGKAVRHVENLVAAVIQGDVTRDAYGKETPGPILRAFMRGDVGAVEQAFNEVKGLFKNVEKGLAAKYSQTKEKTGSLSRPPEGGGLPPPAAKAKPKDDNERVTNAFARLQELAAGGGARG